MGFLGGCGGGGGGVFREFGCCLFTSLFSIFFGTVFMTLSSCLGSDD